MIKEKSLWINVTLEEQKEINSSKHLCFPSETSTLNDLLSFSINLTDDSNKAVEFEANIKFKNSGSLTLNRKLGPTMSTYQIKEEKINFLLEHIEKKLRQVQKQGRVKEQSAQRK